MCWSRLFLAAVAATVLAPGCGAVAENPIPQPTATATPLDSQSCINQPKFAGEKIQILQPNPGAITGGATSNNGQLPGFKGPQVFNYTINLNVTGPGNLTASTPPGQPPYWDASVVILDYGNGCFVHANVSLQPGRKITLPITVANDSSTATYKWVVDTTKP